MWVPLKPRLSQKIIEVPGGRQSILGGKQNWDKNLVRNVEVLQMERDTLVIVAWIASATDLSL
jgi:hypothetical protein